MKTIDIPAMELIKVVVLPSPVPGYTLTAERLKKLAITDVGSAIKYVPGVQLKDYGGIGGIKTVSFRSLGAGHTSVVLDGIKIPNVQSGAINLSSFEIFGVQNLSFLSGGMVNNYLAPASAYQQANIISIQSALAIRPQKFEVRLHSNASSIRSFEEGAIVRIPLGRRSFIGVQGMTRFGDGNYLFTYAPSGVPTEQRRENSRLQSYKLKLAGGMNLGKSNFHLDVNYLTSEQELPGAIILYNPSNDQKLWNEDLRLAARYAWNYDRLIFGLHSFVQNAKMRYYDPHFLNLQGFIDNHYSQNNAGGGFMISRFFDYARRSRVYGGSDIVLSKLTGSDLTANPFRLENNSVIGFSGDIGRLHIQSHVALQALRDESGTSADPVLRTFIKPSPFISLMYHPWRKLPLYFRTHYKRTFVMPTFNDLYYNFIGNNNLRPEEADVFNAGLVYEKEVRIFTIRASADFYYNRVHNKIVAIPTKDIFNWSMQNIGEAEIKGYDLGFRADMKKEKWQFGINASYSYNHSLDVSDPESSTYESQIPYTPFHAGNGGISVDRKGSNVNINVIYTGFRYSLNENIYANYLAPFTDISANVSQKVKLKSGAFFNVTVAAMNLLNKNYEVIRSFPMPGRYYQFTAQFNL